MISLMGGASIGCVHVYLNCSIIFIESSSPEILTHFSSLPAGKLTRIEIVLCSFVDDHSFF